MSITLCGMDIANLILYLEERRKEKLGERKTQYFTSFSLNYALYYMQGLYYRVNHEWLFDEDIIVGHVGPIIPSVYQNFYYSGNTLYSKKEYVITEKDDWGLNKKRSFDKRNYSDKVIDFIKQVLDNHNLSLIRSPHNFKTLPYAIRKPYETMQKYGDNTSIPKELLEEMFVNKDAISVEKNKGLIICGFAGIGKSTLAKQKQVVDLESTPFAKNWDIYSDVAIHMANNGYTVLLSCHKDLREELLKKKANFIVVLPDISLKEEYLTRYKERGNTEEFITLMEQNWEVFIQEIVNDTRLQTKTLQQYEFLRDIIIFK